MNSFGNLFKINTFGESHSKSVGVIIDSPLPNIKLNIEKIQTQLNRRRPGQSHITTPRNENDNIIILSGLENNITLGTPLTIIVNNNDTRPQDYKFSTKNYIPRPSHADFPYLFKYGIHASSGGGRSSARETIGRVIGGSVAEQILDLYNIKIIAFVTQVGYIKSTNINETTITREIVDKFITRCPDELISKKMENYILELKNNGDSVGGIVRCIIKNCPKGLGEPVFDKLEALLAHAMLSIPATKGFEIGSGFDCVTQLGSHHNDSWCISNEKFDKEHKQENVKTETNNNGGIIGGISNGMDITFNVAFKPPATILQPQTTINLNQETVILEAKGRHDPCVVPRAVPIVESMSALVILNMLLHQKTRT